MGESRRRRPVGMREPDDELILAAISRAALHARAQRRDAPLVALRAHLAIPARSAQARYLRARLAVLERDGLVNRTRVRGVDAWGLSTAGARLLASARRRRSPPRLPESPQHAAWRNARVTARAEIERFASRLAADLEEAGEMLASLGAGGTDVPHSDRWLALGPRLLADCRRVGSATHCLLEWQEPDDARPDHDEQGAGEQSPAGALRAGRRNTALWREPL